MANSKHMQICSAAATVLAPMAGASADGGVHENRDWQLATDVSAQVHVNFRAAQPLVGEDGLVFTGHPRDWRTEIEFAFLARKTGSVEASKVADALWVEAYALLMADQSLGGRVAGLEPGDVQLDWAEGDASVCRLTCSLIAQHRTDNHTID